MWNRFAAALGWRLLLLMSLASSAHAGGIQYPGDGTRGLGRGGATMTRPDDPFVMARNPALLADLWGSQLYFNTAIGLPGTCSLLSGGWGWGYGTESVISLGQGEPPLFSGAKEGSEGGPYGGELLDLSPSALPYDTEPYPEICYQGGATLIPNVILASRIGDKMGFGIGFMPPEASQRNGMGGPNGTVETPYGMRPNPLRYVNPDKQHITYFGLLGAVGYRFLPWLRLGAGLRWTMVIADTQVWLNSKDGADPRSDVRADFYGQDIFIPGFTTSIHVVPIDSLDLAVGYRWEERVLMNKSKVTLHSAPFSFYEAEGALFVYQDPDGNIESPMNLTADHITYNIPGVLSAPPPTVPQLSFGIRFADRIRPRPQRYIGLLSAGDPVRDPMADERWDIELNGIYYFASTYDRQALTTAEIARFGTDSVIAGTDGAYAVVPGGEFQAGTCVKEDAEGNCVKSELHSAEYGGRDQWSLRLGGDYNAIVDLLAFRLGLSYETRGQAPGYARPTWNMPFERYGVHAGFTWRIDGRTDLSFGYAHFFQETIELALNLGKEGDGGFPQRFRALNDKEGNYVRTLTDEEVNEKYHVVSEDEADGTAQIVIFSGGHQTMTGEPGRYYANAGTHKFSLDVFSISIMRHF